LGGIGSIPGAVLGGYFIGIAENILIAIPFFGHYIPSNYKDAIAFVALIAFLYFKPTGFFGAKK
jgi:branched-chain amino acid transport system permease protein